MVFASADSENGGELLAVQLVRSAGSSSSGKKTYEEIMLGVLEDHVNRFVLENHLLQSDDVLVADLAVELDSFSASSALYQKQAYKPQFLV